MIGFHKGWGEWDTAVETTERLGKCLYLVFVDKINVGGKSMYQTNIFITLLRLGCDNFFSDTFLTIGRHQ